MSTGSPPTAPPPPPPPLGPSNAKSESSSSSSSAAAAATLSASAAKLRSVVDLDSEEALRRALMTVRLPGSSSSLSSLKNKRKVRVRDGNADDDDNNNNNMNDFRQEVNHGQKMAAQVRNVPNIAAPAVVDNSCADLEEDEGSAVDRSNNNNDNHAHTSRNYFHNHSHGEEDDEEEEDEEEEEEEIDWVLSNIDPETTEVQSMRQELHRLQVLKSYLMLDSEKEEAFDRLTRLGARLFRVPICVISLVDLGRQWFLSNRGLGDDATETPRKHAFCAHTILHKHNILIVPDATRDAQFKDNPAVTGPPGVQFYAGAPLLSPEGYKLGTFCVVDDKVQLGGLSADEQTTLQDLADMVVREMVDRRHRLQQQQQTQDPAQFIAYTAHDLMTPLTGVQLSLALFKEDEIVTANLDPGRLELLQTAAHCSDMMLRICQTAIDTLRQACCTTTGTTSTNTSTSVEQLTMLPGTGQSTTNTTAPSIAHIAELVHSLAIILDPLPKSVPVVIRVDPGVPSAILADDLALFRASLNLLSYAMRHTTMGVVWFRLYVKEAVMNTTTCADSSNGSQIAVPRQLVFECLNTAPDIPVHDYSTLFKPTTCPERNAVQVGLGSVASLMHVMVDAEYGFTPLGMTENDDCNNNDSATAPAGPRHGSIFWFRIPLYEAPTAGNHTVGSRNSVSASEDDDTNKDSNAAARRRMTTILPPPRLLTRSTSRGPKAPIIPNVPRTESWALLRRKNGQEGRGVKKSKSSSSSMCCVPLSSPSSRRWSSGMQNASFPIHATTSAMATSTPLPSLDIATKSLTEALPPGNIPSQVVFPSTTVPTLSNPVKSSINDIVESTIKKEDSPTVARQPARARKRRALVIEDSVVVQKSLVRALEKLGFHVSQAQNGLEGLQRLKESLFDLTLCDFLMPVMDGMDCVKQYRDWERLNRPWMEVWIVGISAHANANEGNQGIIAGMNQFKHKPVTFKDLTAIQASPKVVARSEKLDQVEASIRTTTTNADAEVVTVPTSANDHDCRGGALDAATTVRIDEDQSIVAPDTCKRPHEIADETKSPQIAKRHCLPSAKQTPTTKASINTGASQSLDLPANPVCLMATDKPSRRSNQVLLTLERDGWKVVIVNDGKEALKLLKMRFWDAVLIEDDLPLLRGVDCIQAFREWEEESRGRSSSSGVKARQQNTFLMCSEAVPSPSEKSAIVLPPTGFDGVLNRPLVWKDLNDLLLQQQDKRWGRAYDIAMRAM